MKTSSSILLSGIAFTVSISTTLINNSFNTKDLIYQKQNEIKIDTPDQDRFVKVNLIQGQFTEPTEMAVLPNLDILVAQRRGELMLYKSQTKKLSQVAKLDVYFKTGLSDVNAEEGLLGLTIDPNYASNQYVYLFYSPMGKSVNRLSRFKMVNDMLSMTSEKVVLEFYSQREICCHTGGSLAFGPDGLLYISTGDNSTPFDVPKQQFVNKGYAPLDNRPGLQQYDARRSAGNTNDLRGKILRIKVKEDGTYSIPKGNLFTEGEPKTRPEIFVMGNRNPYRISVDQKTGFLYWGEVGPDASNDDELRGPKGYDEVNQARKAGNFGWPYFIGNNYPYKAYDFTNGTNGSAFDSKGATNNSPNNTGLTTVPAAQAAFIWYPYGESKEFPQVGSGGRTAMAGPVLYNKPGASPYPAYYNGKLIIYEWVRGWIKAVTMAPNGDYLSMEPMMANLDFAAPIDMELGPDGKIYVLEYGKGWFSKNPDAGIARIDYLKGNRPPSISSLIIEKPSGLLPYKLIAKVKAKDADGGPLTYIWNIGNGLKKTTTVPELQHTFTKTGEYPISAQVFDKEKASAKSKVISVFAGNEHPKVDILLTGNKSFYFPGRPVNYQVLVADKGAVVNKERIYVSNSYTEGTDLAGTQLGHQQAAQTLVGKSLMAKSDCSTCHKISGASIGPAFEKISTKYQKEPKAVDYLASKVIKGSSGVWGEVPMPAHAAMKETEVKQIVEWVLSLSAKETTIASLPTTGKITPPETIRKNKSVLTIKATYTDMGAKGLKALTTTNIYNLNSNTIHLTDLKEFYGFNRDDNEIFNLTQNSGWLKLSSIDLTDISAFNLVASSQSVDADYGIEIRLDQQNGILLGKSSLNKPNIPIDGVNDGKFHDVYILFKAIKSIDKNILTLKTISLESK